jgi:hypothetical protein
MEELSPKELAQLIAEDFARTDAELSTRRGPGVTRQR